MTSQSSGPQSPAAIWLAEGAKNLWVTPSLGSRILNICTYNIRTLVGEDKLEELLSQLEQLNWDIIGLSETRIKGTNYTALKTGHALFTVGKSDVNQHGVRVLVHKQLAGNVEEAKPISEKNCTINPENMQNIQTSDYTSICTNIQLSS